MIAEPNCAKNPNEVGSITKYAKIIPDIKHKEEKNTMDDTYFFSLGLRAGSINFHI